MYLLDTLLQITLMIPMQQIHFDPASNELIKVGMLRTFEIIIIFILYKDKLLSILGISNLHGFFVEMILAIALTLVAFGTFCVFDLVIESTFQISIRSLFIAESIRKEYVLEDYIFILVGGMIGPFAEELFFRGILGYHLLSSKLSKKRTVFYAILMIVAFVLPHIHYGQPIAGQWANVFMWSSCAVVAISIYLWRGSIIVPWILHGSANVCLLILSKLH